MDGSSRGPIRPRQEKKCEVCSRTFARTEHLARHRRTHTKEKPFDCPYCRKSFQRSDVKSVHLKKCHAAHQGEANQDAANAVSGRRRVRIACDSCRRKKMRCDGDEICSPCRSAGTSCHYAKFKAMHGQDAARTHLTETEGDFSFNVDEDAPSRPLTSTMEHSDSEDEISRNVGRRSLPSFNPAPTTMPLEVHTEMPVYDIASYEEPVMTLASNDVLFPLPDSETMVDFWQLPMMDSQFWFNESEVAWSERLFESTSPIVNHIFSSPMQNLTTTMQEYFDRKSRAPSPSLNKASKMWYSAPPHMDDHNKDVVRVFLKIFRKHIPETFPLFKNSTAGRHPSAAYTLAMAATGGLFCTVSGSAEVAKSMYNDARRLLLASVNVRNPPIAVSPTVEDRLVTVKTQKFILLELYGLCSGNKRCYEFAEAFHGSLLNALQNYSQVCKRVGPDGRYELDHAQLLETLYILDCYRVIITQRPPSLIWHHMNSFALSPSPRSRILQLYQSLVQLSDGTHTTNSPMPHDFDLATLAGLCSYLWPAIYSQQNRYDGDDFVIDSLSLWKGDFVESGCDNWLCNFGSANASSSHLAVYHMMSIMLHTNLTMLQYFAHSAPGTVARRAEKSVIGKEIHAWTQSRHYKIAHWHAERLIVSVEGDFNIPPSKPDQSVRSRSASSSTEPPRLRYEAPHVPYSVYYATLVLWCGAVTGKNATLSSLTAQALIARGERILSLHKVHIAQLLARVLNEVK